MLAPLHSPPLDGALCARVSLAAGSLSGIPFPLLLSDLSHLFPLVFSELAQTLALLESSSQPPLPGG